ncbi:MAG: beta-lactamase family protein, partial [Bdellovibrionales bacterium]|nr:beta-lactamase family protein [Bdellovibrionales bacterium]
VSWRMPIRALLPGFVGEGVRVDQLLSHSAGQPAWRAFHETLRRELGRGPDQGTRGLERVPVGIRQGLLRRLVLSEPLEAHPGERVLYSDLAFLTLGFAMEEAWGLTLDRAIEREVWGALRVPGLRFHRVSRSVSGGRLDEVAATEDCPWRGGVLQGQVHDDNCWAAGGYGGHAGAFGNARSVLELVAGLHGGGFLSHPTLTRMWARSDEPPGCPRTFGWDTPSGAAPSSGTRFSAENTVGHLGFTGTSLWVDLRAGVAVVLLSNRVHPSRANEGFKPWRARVHDALRDDLGY